MEQLFVGLVATSSSTCEWIPKSARSVGKIFQNPSTTLVLIQPEVFMIHVPLTLANGVHQE